VSVEPFHLFRYFDEQAFRFKNRTDMVDADRFSTVVTSIVGKRLTCAELPKCTNGRGRSELVKARPRRGRKLKR
jgi:hypothetical protein